MPENVSGCMGCCHSMKVAEALLTGSLGKNTARWKGDGCSDDPESNALCYGLGRTCLQSI